MPPWRDDALKRQAAGKQLAATAKPKTDPRIAELRRLEAENAKLAQVATAKAEIVKLAAERDRLQAEVAKRERRAKGKGVRMSQAGFNVFSPKSPRPAA